MCLKQNNSRDGSFLPLPICSSAMVKGLTTRSIAMLSAMHFLACMTIFAHAQATMPPCFASQSLPDGELGRLWMSMKTIFYSSGQERKGDQSGSGVGADFLEGNNSTGREDVRACAATLANVTDLEKKLPSFVVSERMVESLNALGHALKLMIEASLVKNSTMCESKAGTFNQTACGWGSACCEELERQAHAQERTWKTTQTVVGNLSKKLASHRDETTDDALILDSGGSGSGSGSSTAPQPTSKSLQAPPSFRDKLNEINALLKEADAVVSNISVTPVWTAVSLPQRNLTCCRSFDHSQTTNQPELLKTRKDAALAQTSRAFEKVCNALQLHRVATSLKEVVRNVQDLENWWCNQTEFVDCPPEKPGMSNAESGLQTMVCVVMLAQLRRRPTCQGIDTSCCGHLRSLEKLQKRLALASSLNITTNDSTASSLVQHLHGSCNAVSSSEDTNVTGNASCYPGGLKPDRKSLSVCSSRRISISFSCPFPFINTHKRKHWYGKGRSLFNVILLNVLQNVYQLNSTAIGTLKDNGPASIFPCAKSCHPRAQGTPTNIHHIFRSLDFSVHCIWLCVFLRSLYILYINWYKMTGSQPHRSLLLCNFCYAFATISRLFASFYAGHTSATCRDDGSLLEGYWNYFTSSAAVHFCAFSGTINVLSLIMTSVGLSWTILIWYLIIEDVIHCHRTEARKHIGKSFCRRLKDDKRFCLEVIFILLSLTVPCLMTQIILETAKSFVSHPLLNLCMVDNWSQAYIVILVIFYLPAGGILLWIHKRIERTFRSPKSTADAPILRLVTHQGTERIRWYGRRLRIYGISTLAFSSISLIFIVIGFTHQLLSGDQSSLLRRSLHCNLVKSPGQDCPQFHWTGLIPQYSFYWFGQIFCVYHIILLSWCWQRNLKQPANSVLALLKENGNRASSFW